MDIKAIQDLGVNVFLTVSIAFGAFWLIRAIITMGERHLGRYHEAFINVIKAHEEERIRWLSHYDSMSSKLEKSMDYQRQEHERIMNSLEVIKGQHGR